MKSRILTATLLALSVTALAGCATGSNYGGAGYRSAGPLVTTPRVTGGTTSMGSQGRASTVIGNRSTPARVHLQSRLTADGIDITPSLRSRFLNWTFR